MSKLLLKEHALQLRKQGKSYSQIKQILGVSKSTLSIWLNKYPLSKQQIRMLRDTNEARIEKYRETMRLKKEKKLNSYYREAKSLLPLSNRELLFAGIFLYWGEGSKTEPGLISISNTDPNVLQFALSWIINALQIPKKKIRVLLHLYSDMNVQKTIEFWSRRLKIRKNQFLRPYIKNSSRLDLTEKGYGHGTCNIRVSNAHIKQKILMLIKAISDHYAEMSNARTTSNYED